jgi:hypothetical protein
MPVELARQTAEDLRNAADMGNITELKAIAEALRNGSDAYSDISETIERLADDFDLEGIMKLCEEIEREAET